MGFDGCGVWITVAAVVLSGVGLWGVTQCWSPPILFKMEAEGATLATLKHLRDSSQSSSAEIYVWNNSELVSTSSLAESSFNTKVWQHARKVLTHDRMWLVLLLFLNMTEEGNKNTITASNTSSAPISTLACWENDVPINQSGTAMPGGQAIPGRSNSPPLTLTKRKPLNSVTISGS